MLYFIVFPVLGAGIGWLTNCLAIKFLFRPRMPWRIGFLTVQGVIPRRRQELARAVGEVVARELLSWEQIASALNAPEIRTNLAFFAGQAVAERVAGYPVLLPLPHGLRERIAGIVAKAVTGEVDEIMAGGGPDLTAKVLASVDLAGLVEEKLDRMDWDYMESIVYSVAGRELKLIEVMGGILGAVVGLIQAIIIYIF